ncbi:MAG: hypothetical protein AAGA60_10805 [Cyanobacteria bacterium P01_E01_bin.42]
MVLLTSCPNPTLSRGIPQIRDRRKNSGVPIPGASDRFEKLLALPKKKRQKAISESGVLKKPGVRRQAELLMENDMGWNSELRKTKGQEISERYLL